MNFVVDASVACKWYLDEGQSDMARALADSDNLFIAPDFILAEAGNVLWRRLRAGAIEAQQATEAARHLPGMFAALIPSRELLGRALDIARELDHPVYDCFYLAAAENWDAPLVTADDKFIVKLGGSEWRTRAKHLRDYPFAAS
jgi:predicted nucleic acid-binding protein